MDKDTINLVQCTPEPMKRGEQSSAEVYLTTRKSVWESLQKGRENPTDVFLIHQKIKNKFI
jgi:hypothetical protein